MTDDAAFIEGHDTGRLLKKAGRKQGRVG